MREPLAAVDEIGVDAAQIVLDPFEIARNHQLLELLVGRVQHDRGGRLVDLALLDAGEPVFDDVDAADAMRAGDDLEALDQLEQRHLDAVGAHRHARFEVELDVGRLSGLSCGERVSV